MTRTLLLRGAATAALLLLSSMSAQAIVLIDSFNHPQATGADPETLQEIVLRGRDPANFDTADDVLRSTAGLPSYKQDDPDGDGTFTFTNFNASNDTALGAGFSATTIYKNLSADIIGGVREVTTTLYDIAPADETITANGTTTSSVSSGGGFSHSQDANVLSDSVILWDGDETGVGNLNLDLSAQDKFRITVAASDLGIVWAITLFDGVNSHRHVFEGAASGGNAPNSFFDVFLDLQDIWGANGVDLSSVNSIKLEANTFGTYFSKSAGKEVTTTKGLYNVDTTVVDFRTTIPEPAALALFGLGLLGLGAAARRRRA